MEEELTEAEKARMRRMASFIKVVGCIMFKWRRVLTVLFVSVLAVLSAYLVSRASRSVKRFEAESKLLYNPRRVEGIDAPNDKQLMPILAKKALKFRVADKVPMPVNERECLGLDMELVHEKLPTTLYTAKAASGTWEGAVMKANAYAEVLMDEYVKYRRKDLEEREKRLSAEREELVDQLAELDAEESELKTQTGVLSPQEALLAMNALISDQRRNDSALSVDIANEEMKKRKLEEAVGGNGPAIVANAPAIRRMVDAMAEIDKTLSVLRERYTDINPKVTGKLDERKKIESDLARLLEEKGVLGIDISGIDQIEKAAGDLADAITRLEVLEEKRKVLAHEMADSEKRASALAALIPDYERINTDRAVKTAQIRAKDEELNGITGLIGSLKNDLRLIERSGGASDKGAFGPKQMALSLGGAVFLCGGLLLLVVCFELAFGNVYGGREVSAWDGIEFLGSLPKKGMLPEDEDREVMGVVALKVLLANKHRRTLLVCRLPGAEVRDDFEETLEFTETMSGTSSFTVDIVPVAGFSPPEGSEQMIGVVKKGNRGWFPAANRFVMAPAELQMLHADIDELEKSCDAVFIRMDGGVRVGGTFFYQLLCICDGVLLEIGAKKTPRSVFGYARRHLAASGKLILAVATEADAKTVGREMEARV